MIIFCSVQLARYAVAEILIIHGRNETRLRNAEEQVKEAAIENKHDLTLHSVLGDLACIEDIRNIAR